MAGVVFTGAPGSGKTTTLRWFEQQGYNAIPEVARDLIDSGLGPWDDFDRFHLSVFETQIARELAMPRCAPFFADRGIFDIEAFYAFAGRVLPSEISGTRYKPRYSKVFLFELVGSNNQQRTDSRFSVQDRRELDSLLHKAYTRRKFSVVRVKRGTIASRIRFLNRRVWA